MKLKKWVEQVLLIISLFSLIFLASDCEDMKIFIISHLTALTVFIGCVLVLKKYGKGMN